jgi:hypothetical protein
LSSWWSLFFCFPTNILYACLAHLILLDHSNYTWRIIQVMKLLIKFLKTYV